jgi:hypothetical protein
MVCDQGKMPSKIHDDRVHRIFASFTVFLLKKSKKAQKPTFF